MRETKCKNCGQQYDADIYGEACPFCDIKAVDSFESTREIPCVYGPPPINYEPYQEPTPTVYGPPPIIKKTNIILLLIIGFIIGSILCFLLKWL